jgi:hypothetical protein
MAQLPVLRKELRESTGMVRSTVRSEGVGDLTLTAITRFMEKDDQRLFFGVELGTPTGSVHATDTVGGIRERLSYPMQLGLGAWHIQTGLTYQAHSWKYTWGGQVRTLFRLGESDLGYKHGNRYTVSGWLSRRWLRWLSSSLRLEWRKWGNIHGVDPALDPTRSPTADAKRQAGQQLDLGMGLDLNLPFVAHQSLAFEAVVPLVRDLDGPQIEEEWRVQVGWRWSL